MSGWVVPAHDRRSVGHFIDRRFSGPVDDRHGAVKLRATGPGRGNYGSSHSGGYWFINGDKLAHLYAAKSRPITGRATFACIKLPLVWEKAN